MIGPFRNRTLAVSVVAALQLAALGYFVWEREQRVRNGSDVVLEVVPVDPRSLFQGDYVILGYPISTVKEYYGSEAKVGQDVFVTVVKGADGNWHYARHSLYSPMVGDVPGGIVIKGKIQHVVGGGTMAEPGELRVTYGLERFFVPEGKGLDLEALVRSKKLSAIVSVWRDGSSTLKGLSTEGRVLFETGVAAKKPEDVPPLDQVGAAAISAPVEAAPVAAEPVPEAPATNGPPPANSGEPAPEAQTSPN